MAKRYYYITEGRYVARCDENGESLSNAEILRHGEWKPTTPAELVWNAQPISRAEAIDILVKWNPEPITKAEALQLLNKGT